jgi:hypothetical protein
MSRFSCIRTTRDSSPRWALRNTSSSPVIQQYQSAAAAAAALRSISFLTEEQEYQRTILFN